MPLSRAIAQKTGSIIEQGRIFGIARAKRVKARVLRHPKVSLAIHFLYVGQRAYFLQGKRAAVIDTALSGFAFFGRNQNGTVGRIHAIEGGRFGAFQNRNFLNVVRVNVLRPV